MNVCLDIQSAVAQRAGVGRYTRSLVEALAAERGADGLRLFSFDFRRRGTDWSVPGAERRTLRWCPGRLMQASWKTLNAPPFDWLAGQADVYHFPNFIIPPLSARAGRAVVTVHDVSFLRYPELAERRNLAYLKRRIADTVRRADAILTDSRFSAGEIVDLLRADPGRVHAVPLGLGGQWAAPPAEAVARWRRAQGLDRPYLLTVGTLEPRKNTVFLARVYEAMPRFRGDLVIAGLPGWKTAPILARLRASSRAATIRLLGYVPESDLPALYAGAELFLFPSLYEGFGFPPLEAMRCGTPVLASGAGSLPEVLGDGARLLADFDPDAWAADAQRLLDDADARRALGEQGHRWSARYTWRAAARATWAVYRKVTA